MVLGDIQWFRMRTATPRRTVGVRHKRSATVPTLHPDLAEPDDGTRRLSALLDSATPVF